MVMGGVILLPFLGTWAKMSVCLVTRPLRLTYFKIHTMHTVNTCRNVLENVPTPLQSRADPDEVTSAVLMDAEPPEADHEASQIIERILANLADEVLAEGDAT